MRLGATILFVKSLPAMERFYAALLQRDPIAETRGAAWVEFEAGPSRLGLHAIPPEIAARIEINNPPQQREETPLKLVFHVDELAAELDRLRQLGVTLIERPWGGWDGLDPEGNVFGLTQAA